MTEPTTMTLFAQIEQEAKNTQMTQKSLVDVPDAVFFLYAKSLNPTDLNTVGTILNDTMDELMLLSADYLNAIKKSIAYEADGWENIQKLIVAYSSAVSYLKNLQEKIKTVNYLLDKKIPTVFRSSN